MSTWRQNYNLFPKHRRYVKNQGDAQGPYLVSPLSDKFQFDVLKRTGNYTDHLLQHYETVSFLHTVYHIIFFQQMPIASLHGSNRLGFIMEMEYVLCEVGTQVLCAI